MPTKTKMSRSEAARVGARARWGNHDAITFRIDRLSPDSVRVVNVVIAALREADRKADPASGNGSASAQGHGNDRSAA